MNWFQKNFKTIIYTAFLVPILTVAVVSISHVTKWYGISNPVSWAIYLSIGVEIAALSALAAISARMGKKVYIPFGIVTLIQFIGNIFFAYQFIDINSQNFKDWVDMVDPLVSFLGVESGNMMGHKRFLALFAGGVLPLISLSFLHMLVKFEEEDKKESNDFIDIDEVSKIAGTIEKKNLDEESKKYTPTEEEIKKIEEIILKKSVINEIEPDKHKENLSTDKEEVKVDLSDLNVSDNLEEKIEINSDEIVNNIEIINDEEKIQENSEESKIKRLTYLRRDA